jgi:hypothetical protein
VEGFDHTGWLKIVKHFSEAFKTGMEPAITHDSIVLQARPHTRNATAPADKIGAPPFGWMSTEDKFFGTVFATAPAKITLSSAPDGCDAVTSDIPAGVSKIAHPLVVGGTMRAILTRDNKRWSTLRLKVSLSLPTRRSSTTIRLLQRLPNSFFCTPFLLNTVSMALKLSWNLNYYAFGATFVLGRTWPIVP